MSHSRKTGFDKFFDQQMASATFANDYKQARAEIGAVDEIIRALDEAREELGISKAELAREISAKPEIVRRLFTTEAPNPTLGTVVKLALALGYKLELVAAPKRAGPRAAGKGHRRAASA